MAHLKHLKRKVSWLRYKGLFVSNIYHANILLFVCCLSILFASFYIYTNEKTHQFSYDQAIPLDHPPTLKDLRASVNYTP